jgi:tetratricopeptide (TPR) repeat protein
MLDPNGYSKRPTQAEARQLYEESLAIKRRLGDQRGIAQILQSLGTLAENAGDPEEARPFFIEALAIFQHLGSPDAAVARRSLARVSPLPPDSPSTPV